MGVSKTNKINRIKEELGIGFSVANELCLLAGGDIDMVIEASDRSGSLSQCKAEIINKRFEKLEGDNNGEED